MALEVAISLVSRADGGLRTDVLGTANAEVEGFREGLRLGLKFRESFGRAVYIDKILPNTEAARLEREGKIRCGDEIVMVSATFGDEMWSARGVGKYRLEKSIAVRQGGTISFVVENSSDNNKKRMKQLSQQQQKEKDRVSRLQRRLTQEVEAEKKKGGFFGGLF